MTSSSARRLQPTAGGVAHPNVDEAILVLDRDGSIMLANAHAERLFARSSGTLVGLAVDDVLPGASLATPNGIANAMPSDELLRVVAMESQTLLVRGDRRSIAVRVHARRFDDAGRALLVVVASGKTDRGRAGPLALGPEVEHAVDAESAATAMRAVAHDLNNLMMAISWSAKRARSRLSDPTGVGQELADLFDAAEQASTISGQLISTLSLSKPPSCVVRVGAVVEGLAPLIRSIVPSTVAVSTSIEADGFVDIDPLTLKRAILNLVWNSVAAIGEDSPGQIALRLVAATDRPASRVRTDCEVPSAYVALEVTDDGIGMDADTVRSAFDVGFTTRVDGHGIGLAETRSAMRAVGGDTLLASEPGKGTTVRLLLPYSSSLARP